MDPISRTIKKQGVRVVDSSCQIDYELLFPSAVDFLSYKVIRSAKMSSVFKNKPISTEEFLQSEHLSDTRHELINGEIYAMAGASKSHERISVNLLTEFTNHLKNSSCEPFV